MTEGQYIPIPCHAPGIGCQNDGSDTVSAELDAVGVETEEVELDTVRGVGGAETELTSQCVSMSKGVGRV